MLRILPWKPNVRKKNHDGPIMWNGFSLISFAELPSVPCPLLPYHPIWEVLRISTILPISYHPISPHPSVPSD